MNKKLFDLQLPGWLAGWRQQMPSDDASDVQRMAWLISLAGDNICHEGGPFAAGLFDQQGVCVSVGVNLVVPAGCSVLHAEMVALMLAQQTLGRYDLSDGGRHQHTLFSTTEPCAMCLGALPWSGISGLVCAARDEDARAAGFDEGDKPEPWWVGLERRGIKVVRDLCRDQARAVLDEYAAGGGELYNAD